MIRKRIRTYVAVVLLFVLSITSLFVFQWYSRQKIYDYIKFVVGASIQSQIHEFGKIIDDDYSMLSVISKNIEENKYKDNNDLVLAFSPIIDSNASYLKTLAVCDLAGNTVNNKGITDNIKGKWYFKQVIKEKRYFAYSFDVNGDLFFLLSTPYYIDGEIAGAVIGYYKTHFTDGLFNSNVITAYKSILCDGTGKIVSFSPEKSKDSPQYSIFEYLDNVDIELNRSEIFEVLNTNGIFVSKVNYKSGDYYVVGEPLGINDLYVIDIFTEDTIEYSTTKIINASYIAIAFTALFIAAAICVSFLSDRKRFKEEETYRRETLQSQINPHFMFNSLSAICSLINYEPDVAVKMTYDFSKYLRYNLTVIQNDGCIPFEKELDHIKAFCDIDLVRFKDTVKVEYSIETTDFLVPPLCTEMLVENAINYSLRAKTEGGTVTISTEECSDGFKITVSDNGSGYTPDDIVKKQVGYRDIRNIEKRLRKMCGAKLTITNLKNEGTTAVIELPSKNRLGGNTDENYNS